MIIKQIFFFFFLDIVAVKHSGLSKTFSQGQPQTKSTAVEAVQPYNPMAEDLLRACPPSWQCLTCSKHTTSAPSKETAACVSARWNTALLSDSRSAKATEALGLAGWHRAGDVSRIPAPCLGDAALGAPRGTQDNRAGKDSAPSSEPAARASSHTPPPKLTPAGSSGQSVSQGFYF